MKSTLQLRSSSRSPRHLLVFRQIQLQKGILLRKNKSSYPIPSTKNILFNNHIVNSVPNSQGHSNFHLSLNTLKDKTLQYQNSNQSSASQKYKKVKKSLDWGALDDLQHRPRFDRWERKFVSKLAKAGKKEYLLEILK